MKDYVGKRFGRWTILSKGESRYRWGVKQTPLNVICDCGNVGSVLIGDLNRGVSKSCGCIRRELLSEREKDHGMTGTYIYNIYRSIKQRCNNINGKSYKNYGGRGIKCERNSFEEFYRDMGDRPTDKHTIERVNNDGNYCKENCCRATRYEQIKNRRNTVLYKGRYIGDIVLEKGIGRSTLMYRIKQGRSEPELFRPTPTNKRFIG